jgi:hypothetical protein
MFCWRDCNYPEHLGSFSMITKFTVPWKGCGTSGFILIVHQAFHPLKSYPCVVHLPNSTYLHKALLVDAVEVPSHFVHVSMLFPVILLPSKLTSSLSISSTLSAYFLDDSHLSCVIWPLSNSFLHFLTSALLTGTLQNPQNPWTPWYLTGICDYLTISSTNL